MIPSSPSPSLAVRAQPACILVASPPDGGEMAAFSALLTELSADCEDGIAAPAAASRDLAVLPATASLALPGNLLPPELPVAAKIEPKPASPVPAATGMTALPLPEMIAAAPTRPEAGSAEAAVPAARLAAETAEPAARLAARPGPPAEEVRLAIALPGIARLMAKTDEPELSAPQAELPFAVPAAPQGQPSAAPQPVGPAGALRPHDFAALIDRLAAARENAGPASVSVTVAHQEFGPVRLHFRPEEAGLSVALTSADPEFARAASASPAPVQPMQQSGAQSGLASDQRGAGDPAFHGGGAQPRGDGAPRQNRSQPADAAPAVPPPGQPEPAASHGIFA